LFLRVLKLSYKFDSPLMNDILESKNSFENFVVGESKPDPLNF